MPITVATADARLRSRLDTVASGSTWGTETIGYLSQAQRQVVTDLHDSMFTDGNLTGKYENAIVALGNTELWGVSEIARAADSVHVISVTHADANRMRGAKRLDSVDQVYNIASLAAGYESQARGRPVYALEMSKIVMYPVTIGDTITERYVKIPAALTATTDTFQVPDWMVDTVIAYAAYLSLLQVEKGAANAAMAEYKGQIAGWYRKFKLEPPPQFLEVPAQEKV